MSNIIEFHKGNKRVDKILQFLKKTMPEELYIICKGDEDIEPFRETFVKIVEELSYGDKKNLDYKNFPWHEEVRKRMIEKYGFTSTV